MEVVGGSQRIPINIRLLKIPKKGISDSPLASIRKDPLAGAAGEEASLCVVFRRNVSTAMPDLDSGVGTGLGDRVVFLDRVAYCPLQYALRSPTMNRVEMESSLSSSCSDKNTSVPASAKVRFTSNWQSKRPVLPVDSQSLRSHRPPFIL